MMLTHLECFRFFEMLRRDNEKKNEQIRFGVLCGTIVIIPAEAREALEQAIGTVSYTHLDVYKRQAYARPVCLK